MKIKNRINDMVCMKITKLISIIILPVMMAGCGEGNKQSGDDFITVDVTKKYPKKELILQNFLDVEYVPLETSDEFITTTSLQAIGKDIILIKDLNRVNTGNIFIFDRNGKGLRKINRLGQSGEEYTNTHGITFDQDNEEIFINNTFSSKVLVYDLLGNFKRSFKNREGFFYDQIDDFDHDHLICHDAFTELDKPEIKRNFFLIVSKLDGSIKEIPIPYKEKKSTLIMAIDANGEIISNIYCIYNKKLIPYQDSWVLAEPSADTIYTYSQNHIMKPFIVKTPPVQSMDPEVYLFAGVFTDRYYFMQTVKREYDFVKDTGFPSTELMYDKQENAIYEYVVYNDDFINKRPMSMVYEVPIPPVIVNNDGIAFMTRLDAADLVEAYKKGQLKGKLKEIAATLDEESNAVIMLAKYKK